MRQRLRLYFVRVLDDDCGLAVAAHSAKEARAIIWSSGDLCADRIIDLRVQWLKQAVVSGLRPRTILYDSDQGLRRGAYSWAEGPCPLCGAKDAYLTNEGGKIGCESCLDGDTSA
jgi:hypothetical protein